MSRKKPDGFDALADVMRASPDEVLTAAGILMQRRETLLLGMMLRRAVETMRAPKRKAGRPRKEGPFDLPAALLDAAVRRRIDNVADAIVSKGLLRSEAENAMVTAARLFFPARRNRHVALAAMKRFRARLEEVETDPGKRTRDDRPRLYAARVALEAHGEPATAEGGRRLLRRLQRGSAAREAERVESLRGIESVREEGVTALLAKLDEATPKRSR